MRRVAFDLTAVCLALSLGQPARADDSYPALKAEYEAAQKKWIAEVSAAFAAAQKKGEAAGWTFPKNKPSPAPVFSPRFLAITEKSPEGPDALDSLKMACSTSYDIVNRKTLETRGKALRMLRDYHIRNPNLCADNNRLFKLLASYEEKDARAFLDDVIAHNPDRKVQAKVYLALVEHSDTTVLMSESRVKQIKTRAESGKAEDKALMAQQVATAERARSEAEKLYKIIRSKYGDIVNDLAIGQRAPELTSEDLDGKSTRLSDLKGTVVVLDIWATWCGPCKAMIPREREMVARLKDKPFALVSISVDEKKQTLKDFLAKEPMPWTHWWNGTEGMVMNALNIAHYPTIFVLDREGVIRYKEIRGEELEKAVNTLLEEAKANTGKAA